MDYVGMIMRNRMESPIPIKMDPGCYFVTPHLEERVFDQIEF